MNFTSKNLSFIVIATTALFSIHLLLASDCLAQPGKKRPLPKNNLPKKKAGVNKKMKSFFKGAANRLGLRRPSDRRVANPIGPQAPPRVAGPQRPDSANLNNRPAIQYGQLPPNPVVYGRLPNMQAAQPQATGARRFNQLAQQSPVNTGGVRTSGQFQRPGNLNVVDAVARTMYGKNFKTASPGANTLNRLAVERAGTTRQAVRQYQPPASAPPVNGAPAVNRAPNQSARPYMGKLPTGRQVRFTPGS